ncbi:hypothetical protein NPIL_19661 [Nephila pilipes]|uniref:Uncharacterized protein n=1 Tax=Nephila pilipes TaxID=299642 RepID=A0A8X6U5Q7_NEPPI|nr:hypothetical protein NPIL_19661 [Nephila pilipes]
MMQKPWTIPRWGEKEIVSVGRQLKSHRHFCGNSLPIVEKPPANQMTSSRAHTSHKIISTVLLSPSIVQIRCSPNHTLFLN